LHGFPEVLRCLAEGAVDATHLASVSPFALGSHFGASSTPGVFHGEVGVRDVSSLLNR
jgi:hypothetical protein